MREEILMPIKQVNLWGSEFEIPQIDEKKVLKKIKATTKSDDEDYTKLLKSKKVSLDEKLQIINENVYKILGHYKDDTLVIRDRAVLHDYISKAIENDIFAFDTETNNSLDTVTCKLMGPCIYTPGMKQAYIPINHINNKTNELLDHQLTEQDVREELLRITDSGTKVLMHNGKFDYEVIYTTCHMEMTLYWDTYIAARMLDENEPSAGLKQQYINKIDPDQEKYNIEELFKNVEYAQVDPEVFALYAATDAKMTYDLYLWQKAKWESDASLSRMYDLFLNVDVPISLVIAKMELDGVCIDFDYIGRLSNKYHKILDHCDTVVDDALSGLKDAIAKWRLTPDANYTPPSEPGKNIRKSKAQQLSDPIKLSSPTQLAILLYDICKLPVVDKEKPRGTGVDELEALQKKESPVVDTKPLIEAILQKRTIAKLVSTYVDKMPSAVNAYDNKIHANFFNVATSTHRFSSSNPNLQNLPRDAKDIRVMFCGSPKQDVDIELDDNKTSYITLGWFDEINTTNGYKKGNELDATDVLIDENNNQHTLKNIYNLKNKLILEI